MNGVCVVAQMMLSLGEYHYDAYKSKPLFTSPVHIPGSVSNPVMNAGDDDLVPI